MKESYLDHNGLERCGECKRLRFRVWPFPDFEMCCCAKDQTQQPMNSFRSFVDEQRRRGRPPIGVMPTRFWNEQRKADIEQAILGYAVAEKDIPKEWIAELQTLTAILKQ